MIGGYMKIAIIDADLVGDKKHRFPNLACMKISGFYKKQGNFVELKTDYENLEEYDKVFISKVFTNTPVDGSILSLPNVEYGGTGFFYDKAPRLPDEIEHCMPDYHLYDDWVKSKIEGGENRNHFKFYLDYMIGMVTRGCFRGCEFCVNKNYKKSEAWSPISEFWDNSRKKICLLDDNFFACSKWKEILQELKDTKKPFQFRQGLDERLLTHEKCEMLFSSKYDDDYTFAFDNIEDECIIREKAYLIRQHYKKKGQHIKFYVLCGFDRNDKYDLDFWKTDVLNLFKRIFILAEYNFKPYVMRYEKYKESPYYGTYVSVASWCNQPNMFMNLSYKDFVEKQKYSDRTGKIRSIFKYYEQTKNISEDVKKYTEIVPKDVVLDYSNW